MPNLEDWIKELFEDEDLLEMGHGQRKTDLNLGLGWLYYAFARVLRPKLTVVIGSWRGFTPMLFGRASSDNDEGGEVIFIDPSLVDDFWTDPDAVRTRFAGFGVTNVRHFPLTTQQFVETDAYAELDDVGLLFVDGFHTREQARFDHEAFASKLTDDAIVMFHDTKTIRTSEFYGPDKIHTKNVREYVRDLETRDDLQVFDIPFAEGVTLVRKRLPDPPPEPRD